MVCLAVRDLGATRPESRVRVIIAANRLAGLVNFLITKFAITCFTPAAVYARYGSGITRFEPLLVSRGNVLNLSISVI